MLNITTKKIVYDDTISVEGLKGIFMIDYYTELRLNKANSFDAEIPFLGLFITNGIVSSIIYDKRDDFSFEIFIFPFLDGDVSRSLSSVYIFHSLFVMREYVLMLVTSTTETNFDGLVI